MSGRSKLQDCAPIDYSYLDSIAEELFNKYGPEGAYELGEKLQALAFKDYDDAVSKV